jgi:hypothetical protein
MTLPDEQAVMWRVETTGSLAWKRCLSQSVTTGRNCEVAITAKKQKKIDRTRIR